MLTEQSAYSNRWRTVSPAAKGLFSLCGMIAAFASGSARTAAILALIMAAAAIFGAGVSLQRYTRIAAPPLLFLLTSGITLAVSLDFGTQGNGMSMQLAHAELSHIAYVCSRSVACLAALLFFALTTPLSDIISLLRRCRMPETMLDLMTLCYRTLFVLSETIHETITAQSARLGYSSARLSLHSLGRLITNLAVQVWQRSQALQMAAEARGNDSALRFLENRYANTPQNISIAGFSGCLMIVISVLLP